MSNLHDLQLQRFRMTLRCQTALQFKEFIGNDLRGGFGAILRNSVCGHPQSDGSPCAQCLDSKNCIYGSLFESYDLKGSHVARPYVLEPLFTRRTDYAAGDEVVFNLVLIGHALEWLDVCRKAWRDLGVRGLGLNYHQGRGRFEVERVEATSLDGTFVRLDEVSENPQPAPRLDGASVSAWTQGLAPRRLAFHCLTPLQLRSPQPHRRSLGEGDIEFHHLWDGLQRRLEDLLLYHCGQPYTSAFGALKRQALSVRKVEDSLHWQPQWRNTSQHQDADMGGLLGHVVFEGDLAPFLPVLAVGEWIHLGHGADLGNGRYHLLPDITGRPL